MCVCVCGIVDILKYLLFTHTHTHTHTHIYIYIYIYIWNSEYTKNTNNGFSSEYFVLYLLKRIFSAEKNSFV